MNKHVYGTAFCLWFGVTFFLLAAEEAKPKEGENAKEEKTTMEIAKEVDKMSTDDLFEHMDELLATRQKNKDVTDLFLVMREEQDYQKALRGDIKASYDGHDTAVKSFHYLSFNTTLSKGSYPREFRMETANEIQLTKDKVDQNVTALKLNYDYHPAEIFELFAFMNRISDEYMSIQERFEFGGGGKLELAFGGHVGDRTNEKLELLDLDKKTKAKEEKAKEEKAKEEKANQTTLLATIQGIPLKTTDGKPSTLDEKTKQVIERVSDKANEYHVALHKRKSRFLAGIAIAAMSELEQPGELEEDGIKVQPASEQAVRLNIRPNAYIRITEEISGYIEHYWKIRVDSGEDGDVRRDFKASISLELEQEEEDPGVVVEFTFERRFDPVPPRVGGISAQRVHNLYNIGVGVKWGD